MTPFDEWFKNKEKALIEKFGTLVAKELRSEMYSSFEFGASIGFKQGKREEDF
jgi:hypothetical protein